MDDSASHTLTLPGAASRHYDIWLATRFSVSAPSYHEANAQAVAWLTKRLSAEPEGSDRDADSVTVTISAQTLHEAAVLAIKLLALEEKGGESLRRVEQLRAEVDDLTARSRPSSPDFVSR